MATISEVSAVWKYAANCGVRVAAADIVREDADVLVSIQKDQLWAGQDLSGGDLTPSILDDPFFEGNRRRAQVWSDFKDRQHQWAGNGAFAPRRRGTPNLIYTTGAVVWDNIRFTGDDAGFYISVRGGIHEELEAKYGAVFGLNPTGARYYLDKFFRNRFFTELHRLLTLSKS
jgi:hypothetical protein